MEDLHRKIDIQEIYLYSFVEIAELNGFWIETEIYIQNKANQSGNEGLKILKKYAIWRPVCLIAERELNSILWRGFGCRFQKPFLE